MTDLGEATITYSNNEELRIEDLIEDGDMYVEGFNGKARIGQDDFEKIDDDKTIEDFIDKQTWEKIGKDLQDYDENDMDMLRWKSVEECIGFYYIYARAKGFGVRRGTTIKSRKDGQIISKDLMCCKEGYRREKYTDNPNRVRGAKAITRVGCKASITFKLHKEYKFWKVARFQEEHNHDMIDPKHMVYVRSFKEVTDADKSKIKSTKNAGIVINGIMQNIVNEAGSHENVRFLQKDLYNCVQSIQREEVRDVDAETVMAYLSGIQDSDPSFFLRYTMDGLGNLEKLFWCDGMSRIDYKTFGHVLAFDTTYKCNAYNKPFVVLFGVNHHRNTVPFGCTLVVNEKEDTYAWVLQQLVEAGDGYKPLTVITDGDKAMEKAIAQVFPEARHRLCLWHLMRNVKAHGDKKFLDRFMHCVDNCRTIPDFESAWIELVRVHGYEEKRWAKELYEVKEKWAEAYMRGYFYAGMRSTHRCETMHRTLKRMLNKKVKLYNFVMSYTMELKSLRWEEERQNYRTMEEQPVCDGVLYSVKSHAAQVYTRNSFKTLCHEMSYEGYYVVKRRELIGGCIFYWLEHCEKENVWYLVIKENSQDTMYCCCMKLESIGFPCRHMFSVLKYEKAKKLPIGCILKRWTIYAKTNVERQKDNDIIEGNTLGDVQARYSTLTSYCMDICHRASQTFQTFTEVKDQFAKMHLSLQWMKVGGKKRNTKKKGLHRIDDPLIIEEGEEEGIHKKSKVQASSSTPMDMPACKGLFSQDTETNFHSGKLNLNNASKPSPSKASGNTGSINLLSQTAMSHMPNTFEEEGVASKASFCQELLEDMEDDRSVFYWKPNNDW